MPLPGRRAPVYGGRTDAHGAEAPRYRGGHVHGRREDDGPLPGVLRPRLVDVGQDLPSHQAHHVLHHVVACRLGHPEPGGVYLLGNYPLGGDEVAHADKLGVGRPEDNGFVQRAHPWAGEGNRGGRVPQHHLRLQGLDDAKLGAYPDVGLIKDEEANLRPEVYPLLPPLPGVPAHDVHAL